MEYLFKVIDLKKEQKIGNLQVEAHSKVKSTKYFPIYMINSKKMIFKPLSKTKPLTTPFFAYSEVYWSYVISKYFISKTPRYSLAVSDSIEKEQPKYFNKGVLVEVINPNDEEMINLFDYFNKYPESAVDIKDYVNYCMKNYDYTNILLSNFIKNNNAIGEELAYQILLSILRQDQNFHYENINFIVNENKLSLAPPIDFEFSTPFLYPDKIDKYKNEQEKYKSDLTINYEETLNMLLLKYIHPDELICGSVLIQNICLIVKMYPDIVLKFINDLENFIQDIPQIRITDYDNYIGPLNSDYWLTGNAFYKENDIEKYEKLRKEIILETINKELVFNRISNDVLEFSKYLALILKTYLFAYYNGIEKLETLTLKDLFTKLNIDLNSKIEDIDINSKKLILK